MKFVIRNKSTGKYLTSDYYRGNLEGRLNLKDAHLFSPFELLLASRAILKNKSNYIVYEYNQLTRKYKEEMFEFLYE